MQRKQQFRYLVVLDFEATCFTDSAYPDEIIEWPAMIIDTLKKCILDNYFHFFIKPRTNTVLSSQCIELTGIKQEIINQSPDITHVIKKWNEFCYLNNILSHNSCIVTCGNWDLKTMWPTQSEIINTQTTQKIHYSILNFFRHSIIKNNNNNSLSEIPIDILNIIKYYCTDSLESKPVLFHSWINIKHLYHEIYNKRVNGMKDILYQFCIPHQGTHHSGIDDVTNICSIVLYMLNKDILFVPTFTNYDDMTDIKIRETLDINLETQKTKMLNDEKFMRSFCIGERVYINDDITDNNDTGNGIIEIRVELQNVGKRKIKKTIVKGISLEVLDRYGITGIKTNEMKRMVARKFSTKVAYKKLSKFEKDKVLIINGSIAREIAEFMHVKWNIPAELLYYKIDGNLMPCRSIQ
eukprot:61080_1